MKKATVFGFVAKLEKKDAKNSKGYFIAPFKVVAKTYDEAKEKLIEYLNRPEHTGLRYDSCLEIIDSSADIVLVNDDYEY